MKVKSIITLLLAWASISFGCNNIDRPTDVDVSKKHTISYASSYEETADRLGDHNWVSEEDPRVFMEYCDALVETGRDLPDLFNSSQVQVYKKKFVNGYYYLAKGKIHKSLKLFTDLTRDENSRDWGYIGLLEYALYTERITDMAIFLKSLEMYYRYNPTTLSKGIYTEYNAWYNFRAGYFTKVRDILQEAGDQLDIITRVLLSTELDLREDRFDEIEANFRSLPPDVLNNQLVIALESKVIRYRDGSDSWSNYLRGKYEEFPGMPIIELYYANALIETGQIKSGIRILKKLSQNRPYDIVLQLILAENLLYFGQDEEELNKVKEVLDNKEYSQFAQYNILSAKINFAKEKKENANKFMSIANGLYSNNPELLWVKYYTAIDEGDLDTAKENLNKLLSLHPNKIDLLASLIELSYLRDEWGRVFLTEEKLKMSKRHISDAIWDEINAFVAISLAKTGRFKESYLKLENIKSLSMRSEILSEIKNIEGHN